MQGNLFAQRDSSVFPKKDSALTQKQYDSTQSLLKDSASLALVDSLQQDSLKKRLTLLALLNVKDTTTYSKYLVHPYLPLQIKAIYQITPERKPLRNDLLFYLLTGLVAMLAAIRLIFPKYFKNLFLLIMKTSVRQKQTREQLLQNNLASVLLNLLFLVTTGIYISLLVHHKQWVTLPLYQLFFYSSFFLLAIYLGKYLFLLFSGWVFNVSEATGSYTYIVFLVNKVLGIVLIPFVLLITYAPTQIMQIATTLSLGICILFFIYRYLISFGAIKNNLKVSAFHFFLYLCAVELLPLALIYKLLLDNIIKRI